MNIPAPPVAAPSVPDPTWHVTQSLYVYTRPNPAFLYTSCDPTSPVGNTLNRSAWQALQPRLPAFMD